MGSKTKPTKTISFRSSFSKGKISAKSENFFSFGDHHFRRKKSLQKQMVSKKRSSGFALILPFENGVLQTNKVFSQSGTFREFGLLGFFFRNKRSSRNGVLILPKKKKHNKNGPCGVKTWFYMHLAVLGHFVPSHLWG